ncbi:MAG: hypothetical protein KAG61_01275 [Bacteriovoracaceae bacterium]|nr:hypothetical protein [Bacteriovoracaceae bacterium]
MDLVTLKQYWPILLIIAYFGHRKYKTIKVRKMIPELKKNGVQIVDVRSPDEFKAGNNPESINLPVNAILTQISKLKKDLPVIVCCASGSRSGVAAHMIRAKGFKVYNAGNWQNTF